MTTSFTNLKPLFHIPEWRPMAPALNAHAAGVCIASDPRGNGEANPFIYELASNTVLNRFMPLLNEHNALASPVLAGTFGAGASMVFHPTQGPRGVLAAGNTASKIVLSTALPAAVGVNQLANRGDGRGYTIRIVGNAAGSSGKSEEKKIIANTAGTTPTIWLDSGLTFTPASGDTYEILAGRVFLLGAGALAAGIWKYYDIATNSYSGSLATANLPATIGTDSAMLAMSESNVPNSQTSCYQGFYGNLVATASAAGTITGTVGGGDSAVLANEYRNFQIRIVQDAATPTAVGQRRRIASHTAGPSPIYTLASNWTVTPSSTATYALEYDDDKILLWSSGVATTYTYNITANTWDTTTFGAKGGNAGIGSMAFGAWGITPDIGRNARHSMIHVFRGGNVATLDILDIAGGANGAWENGAVIGGTPPVFSNGSCGVHDPNAFSGQWAYINVNAGQRLLRYDMINRVVVPFSFLPVAQSTTYVGARLATTLFIDGAAKMTGIHLLGANQANIYQVWAHI